MPSVLVAPDSFKGTLTAAEVAAHVAAVGDRQHDDVEVGAPPQQPGGDVRGHFSGSQRALERVGGDEQGRHGRLPVRVGSLPMPVLEPAGSGPGRQSSTRTAARAPGQVETVTILKTAPVGSATLAIRPYGVSTAGSSTLPPSRSAAARAASVSGNPK